MTRRAYVFAALVAGLWLGYSVAPRSIAVAPPCPEDAVAVGVGDYEAGAWSSWRCIARDDLAGAVVPLD